MLYGPVGDSSCLPGAGEGSHAYGSACQIRDADSASIVSQLLYLEAEEASKPIHLYINSPGTGLSICGSRLHQRFSPLTGGSVTAGLAIYDTVSCREAVGGCGHTLM